MAIDHSYKDFLLDRVSGIEVPRHMISNFFLDTPQELLPSDPYEQFALACMNNIGFATKILLNIELMPYQQVILEMLMTKTFPFLVGSRGAGKSFILALYACLRAMLTQGPVAGSGSKVVITSAAYRQSINVFKYIKDQIYPSAPLFRQSCNAAPVVANDRCRLFIGHSSIMALPLGDGQKIRGERATNIIADEFATIPEEVFNIVIRGFAAVAQDPVARVIEAAERRRLIEAGELDPNESVTQHMGNQLVISGTMYYQFNHFYKKMNSYYDIINNRIFDEEEGLNWQDYAVLKLPREALPEGVLDKKMLADSKQNMPLDLFRMEYDCVAPADSAGFFKRSLVDSCVSLDHNIELTGRDGKQYVMGIDPARKNDNFSITVLRLDEGCSPIVYVKTLNNKNFPECCKTVREIIKRFNIVFFAMDQGGGGMTIQDLLALKELMEPGEDPIYDINDKEALDQKKAGRYIMEVVPFTPNWISDANYDLKADLEHKRILFPTPIIDDAGIKKFESESVWENIEDTKREMAAIVQTFTAKTETAHFDIDEETTGVKRKDRYSSLLLAAYAARRFRGGINPEKPKPKPLLGGWAGRL